MMRMSSALTDSDVIERTPGGVADVGDGIRYYLVAGLAVVVLLVGGVGGWATTASLAGAVLAHGTVVVDSNVRKVQHPTGGVVGEIRVNDGDRVNAGDLLIRLDETVTRANLGIVIKQLDELAIRQARFAAERDGAETIVIPESLARRQEDPEVERIIAGERMFFDSRRAARAGQRAQLRERIIQLKDEIAGIEAQQQAKTHELALINKELEGLEKLWAKNLVSMSKYTATQREAARLAGECGQLVAQAAQARGKIAEIELQILQLDQDLRAEVMKDLREAQAKEAELNERRAVAEDQLKRIEIRAPQSGVVHQLAVHTVGGVVTPSELIMLIVPESDALVIEAKIAPQDIDHVHTGGSAHVRLPAFNQRTTPEFAGTVSRVAADVTKEQQTGQSYYVARIALPDGGLTQLGDHLRLIPGMPAEVHIRTSDRTALSYLVKPLRDQFVKAFKEQ
jgi:membrane fusion protein, type I secretion system